MARLSKEELDEIKEKYGVNRLWSWSRMNTFVNSKYEYLLKYILKAKEDRCDSCYTTLGTICHDTLDRFYEGKIEYDDMIDEYEDGFTTAITIADLKFNRSDEEKNKSIGEKYNENLIHFFKNHRVYEHKLLIEKPIVVNIDGSVFIGYIDALYKDEDGYVYPIDFKSSSIYTGDKLAENSGQLILYSIGLSQMGIPLDKLRPQFNFLKYCTVQYQLKKGDVKYRNVERCKLGESLQSNARTWLKHFGYEPDEYLKQMLDTNGIDCLPDEVRAKYEITDCHVDVELNEDVVKKWKKHITVTLQDIELREQDYNETKSDKCFWDDEESIKKQNYYYSNLCGYSINKLLPYKEYLAKLEASKNGDIFGNLGMPTTNTIIDKVIESKSNELDLSWLDSL